MSTHFNLICETCEIEGPQIRRGASLTFLPQQWSGENFKQDAERGMDEWYAFLSEHEFHHLELKTGP